MRVFYHYTLCVSSDKNATAGQILPILEKLKEKLKVEEDYSYFKRAIKEKEFPGSPDLSEPNPVVVAEEGPDANIVEVGSQISLRPGFFNTLRAGLLNGWGHSECGAGTALT
ncbi:unnamed protein product [Merluccius merluccius]